MDSEIEPESGWAGPAGAPVGRRLFLGLLGAGVAGMALTRWSYRQDDATSNDVAEAVPISAMNNDREDLEGVHPNHDFSGRFRYYSVGTIPSFSERAWRLTVDGEGLDSSLKLRYGDVKAFPQVGLLATFRCITGWRVRDCLWRGVRLRDVIDAARPNAGAQNVTFYSSDGVYTESLTMPQARSDHAILCWEFNGQPLIREAGFPLRLIFPDMYGYKNIKWLQRIEVKPQRDQGFWEQHGGWEIDAFVYNPDQFGK